MIRNIILALFAFIIVAVIIVWILNRGPQKIFQSVRNFSFIGAATSTGLALPWQPTSLFPYVDDADLFGDTVIDGTADADADPASQLADIQKKYEQIMKNVDDVTTFGNPSPMFGSVRIVPAYSNTAGNTADEEFIVLESSLENTAPLSIAGWSLQSALTGVRVAIPDAAAILRGGDVNNATAVSLNPGTSAVVSSGVSPVGISFRENICTGYISQFQLFYPSLSLQCPTPSSELPLTAENLKQYGDECFDILQVLPTCLFPENLPQSTTPACQSFLKTTLSYNGCVSRHRAEPSFGLDAWRLYLGSPEALWRNTHDAIRLLDSEGQTVDVYVY